MKSKNEIIKTILEDVAQTESNIPKMEQAVKGNSIPKTVVVGMIKLITFQAKLIKKLVTIGLPK